jgi:hypothetical protein
MQEEHRKGAISCKKSSGSALFFPSTPPHGDFGKSSLAVDGGMKALQAMHFGG